jgi:hypothetical protein
VDVKKKDTKLTRKNYEEYSGFFGKEGFFQGEFGAIKDKFDIEGGF